MTTTERWNAQRYLVVDVEGNGAHPPELVELGVVPVVHGVIGEPASWLVRPLSPITWQARKVHGITNDAVADLPGVDGIRDDVLAHLSDMVIVGHNVRIDLDVLTRELPGWQPAATLDTLRLARALLPDLPSRKLGALVEHFALADGLPPDLRPHRAAYDALVTARLLVRLATRDDATAHTVTELRDLGALSFAEIEPEPQLGLFP